MKRNRFRKLLIPALLAGASAGLGGVLFLQLSTTPEAASIGGPVVAGVEPAAGAAGPKSPAAAKRGAKHAAAADVIAVPPLSEYAAIADRPLFRSTRRRPDPPAVADTPEPATSFSSKLVGIMIGAADRVAWMRDATGEVVPVRVGERVQGWLLRGIESEKVVFEGERTEELKLFPEPVAAQAAVVRPNVGRASVAYRPPTPPAPPAQPAPAPQPAVQPATPAVQPAVTQRPATLPYRASARRPEQR